MKMKAAIRSRQACFAILRAASSLSVVIWVIGGAGLGLFQGALVLSYVPYFARRARSSDNGRCYTG